MAKQRSAGGVTRSVNAMAATIVGVGLLALGARSSSQVPGSDAHGILTGDLRIVFYVRDVQPDVKFYAGAMGFTFRHFYDAANSRQRSAVSCQLSAISLQLWGAMLDGRVTPLQDFRQLKVWQKSHELTLAIYRVTRAFPRDEQYGVTSQLRRSAASIPANLAEGRCRQSDRDFRRFVGIALGSAAETEYHLVLSRDLGYIEDTQYDELSTSVQEVKRMLSALYTRLSS